MELIEDEDARPDDKIFEKDEVNYKKELITKTLEILDEREIKIIKDRHLSEGVKTLDILGKELNISKSLPEISTENSSATAAIRHAWAKESHFMQLSLVIFSIFFFSNFFNTNGFFIWL